MKWDSGMPIAFLPSDIREYFVCEADFMYGDLRDNRLVVILADAPYPRHPGHMIRVVESENPYWYQEIFRSYNHFRRDRSLRSLDRIRNQKDRPFKAGPYKYDAIYRGLIYEKLTEGYLYMGERAPPCGCVCQYFGIDYPGLEDMLLDPLS